jgi:hypothetical protein
MTKMRIKIRSKRTSWFRVAMIEAPTEPLSLRSGINKWRTASDKLTIVFGGTRPERTQAFHMLKRSIRGKSKLSADLIIEGRNRFSFDFFPLALLTNRGTYSLQARPTGGIDVLALP